MTDRDPLRSGIPRTLFVTVGTTLFEPLIENVSSSAFLRIIASQGFRRLVIQYGRGSIPSFANPSGHDQSMDTASSSGTYRHEVSNDIHINIEWEIYRFKPTLEKDMRSADLIISHAGAGSIMEGLSMCKKRNENLLNDENTVCKEIGTGSTTPLFTKKCKKLVVVINDKLMDNHQSELAEALGNRGYLFVLNGPSLLLDDGIMEDVQSFCPMIFSGGNPHSFGRLLNGFMGSARTS